MSQRLAELVELEDLTGDLRLIADNCGIDVARALLAGCSGVTLYIPSPSKMDEVMKRYIDKRLGRAPRGELEIKTLAVELDLSTSSMRTFVRRMYG